MRRVDSLEKTLMLGGIGGRSTKGKNILKMKVKIKEDGQDEEEKTSEGGLPIKGSSHRVTDTVILGWWGGAER